MLAEAFETWSALDSTKRELRVLILQSHHDIDVPLSDHLITVSLDSHFRYDATSHAWGGAGWTLPLCLAGTQMLITEAFDACLRYLRHPTSDRTLWIDNICVNQNDVWRRAPEASLMQYIFTQAKVVRAWLGSGCDKKRLHRTWLA